MMNTSLIVESQTHAQIKKRPIAVGAFYDSRITNIVALPPTAVKAIREGKK